MRNNRTDYIGDVTTQAFKRSKVSVELFIERLVKMDLAFDTTKNSYHIMDNSEIVSVYYAGNRWNAKY